MRSDFSLTNSNNFFFDQLQRMSFDLGGGYAYLKQINVSTGRAEPSSLLFITVYIIGASRCLKGEE